MAVAAKELVVKAPYEKGTLYSSILLGFYSHVDAAKTKYIGIQGGHHAFRDEMAPHIVRRVPASGTDGVFGIVHHKDVGKIRMVAAAPVKVSHSRNNKNSRSRRNSRNNRNNKNSNSNSNSNSNENTRKARIRNARNARKARKARKARATRKSHGTNNKAYEGNVSE